MRIERRLRQPWWLTVVVPVASLAVAFLLSAAVLLLTGHPPIHSFHRLFDAAFIAHGALGDTVVEQCRHNRSSHVDGQFNEGHERRLEHAGSRDADHGAEEHQA